MDTLVQISIDSRHFESLSSSEEDYDINEDSDSDGVAEPICKKRKKKLDSLKRKMLLKRKEKIWNEVCQYAGEENVAEWRVLGLLLTRSSNKDAKRIGQELWTNTKSEGKLPVEPAMTMMMDSKLGRATYNSQREKRMPGISTYYFCYMAFTIISSLSTSKLSISSISGNVPKLCHMSHQLHSHMCVKYICYQCSKLISTSIVI